MFILYYNKSMFRGILLLFLLSIILAHPHSFIDYTAEVCFDDKGVQGISTIWYFDDMFSSFVESYDEDKNKVFSEEEASLLKQEAFDNLKEYNYFSRIYLDGKAVQVNNIKDFYPFFKGNIIAYKFFIPLEQEITSTTKELVFMFFDPTYYIHVEACKDQSPVSFRGNGNYKLGLSSEKRKKDAYYNGWIIPEAFKVKIQRK